MPEIWFPNMGIAIEHLDRVAITLFGQDIYWYGVLIGLGIFLGTLLMCQEAKRTGQNPDEYVDLLLIMLILGFIGARIYYVAFSWENYKDDLMKIFAFREGGIAIYGGVIGGALAILGHSKSKKKDFWVLADTIVPSLILGQAIGRWGNFINREAFGGYTDSFFALRYKLDQVRISDISLDTLNNVITVDGMSYIQVHPTFLYESIWNFGVLALLLWITRNKKFNGQVTAWYFIAYGIGRFWIEGLRTDQLRYGNFAVSQVLSVILIIVSIVFIFWRKKQVSNNIQGEETEEKTGQLTVDKLAEMKQEVEIIEEAESQKLEEKPEEKLEEKPEEIGEPQVENEDK